jgi:hypothetical protein
MLRQPYILQINHLESIVSVLNLVTLSLLRTQNEFNNSSCWTAGVTTMLLAGQILQRSSSLLTFSDDDVLSSFLRSLNNLLFVWNITSLLRILCIFPANVLRWLTGAHRLH